MKFAVLGHPVAHSLSPRMHAANFRALGRTDSYDAFDVPPEDLGAALDRLAAAGYRGLNVTVPHKEHVREFLTRLAPSADRAGAVNTVVFEADGTRTGHNTDMAGFRASLDAAGFDWSSARVLLLGAGGASRAVARACLDAGCAALTVANRTRVRAEELVAWTGDPRASVADSATVQATDFDLVVNATSVGLRPADPPVLPQASFRPDQIVYDLIPVARETATCAVARAAGARTFDGLGMLVAQGAASFEIWTGCPANPDAMRTALI